MPDIVFPSAVVPLDIASNDIKPVSASGWEGGRQLFLPTILDEAIIPPNTSELNRNCRNRHSAAPLLRIESSPPYHYGLSSPPFFLV